MHFKGVYLITERMITVDSETLVKLMNFKDLGNEFLTYKQTKASYLRLASTTFNSIKQ